MNWILIDRDENGYATKVCINKMLESLPIVVVEHFSNVDVELYKTISEINLQDEFGEIVNQKRYTHYLPIPKASGNENQSRN